MTKVTYEMTRGFPESKKPISIALGLLKYLEENEFDRSINDENHFVHDNFYDLNGQKLDLSKFYDIDSPKFFLEDLLDKEFRYSTQSQGKKIMFSMEMRNPAFNHSNVIFLETSYTNLEICFLTLQSSFQYIVEEEKKLCEKYIFRMKNILEEKEDKNEPFKNPFDYDIPIIEEVKNGD